MATVLFDGAAPKGVLGAGGAGAFPPNGVTCVVAGLFPKTLPEAGAAGGFPPKGVLGAVPKPVLEPVVDGLPPNGVEGGGGAATASKGFGTLYFVDSFSNICFSLPLYLVKAFFTSLTLSGLCVE